MGMMVIVVVVVMVVLESKRVLLIDDMDESIRVNCPEKSMSCRGTRQNWSHVHPLDMGNLNTIRL